MVLYAFRGERDLTDLYLEIITRSASAVNVLPHVEGSNGSVSVGLTDASHHACQVVMEPNSITNLPLLDSRVPYYWRLAGDTTLDTGRDWGRLLATYCAEPWALLLQQHPFVRSGGARMGQSALLMRVGWMESEPRS